MTKKVDERCTLTQFRNDLLYADFALVHQVSHSVQTLTEWLLCFFETGQKQSVSAV